MALGKMEGEKMIGRPKTDCQSCSNEFVLCEETALIILFTYQPQYDYIQIMCPFCGYVFYVFTTGEWAINFIRRQVPVVVEEFAEYHIVKGWHDIQGLKLPRRKRLNKIEKAQVENFRDELSEVNTFADWLRKNK